MSINEFTGKNQEQWLNIKIIMSVVQELDEKLEEALAKAGKFAEKEGARMTLRMLRVDVRRVFNAVRDMHYLGLEMSEAGNLEADRANMELNVRKEVS